MATCLSTYVAQEKFKWSHFIFQAGEWKWGEAVEGSGREVPERWVHPLCLHRQKLIPIHSQSNRGGHNFPFCRLSWWTVYVFHRMGVPSVLTWSDFTVQLKLSHCCLDHWRSLSRQSDSIFFFLLSLYIPAWADRIVSFISAYPTSPQGLFMSFISSVPLACSP